MTDPAVSEGKRLALISLLAAAAVCSLDASVNIGFPSIIRDFGIAQQDIRWIIISFILPLAGFTIVFGKLGDNYGYRRIYLIGTIASLGSLLLCGLSVSYPMLITARFAQGLSNGMMLSCLVALVTSLLPAERKPYAIGLFVTAIGLGQAAAPLMGGLLVEFFNWRAIFLGRAVLLAGVLVVALIAPIPRSYTAQNTRFDLIGGALLFAALTAAIGFSITITRPSLIFVSFVLIPTVGGLVWAFVRVENRQVNPIIQVRYLRDRFLLQIQLSTIAANFCIFMAPLLLPLALGVAGGVTAWHLGLVLAAWPIGTALAAPVSRRLPQGGNTPDSMIAGLFLCAGGLIGVAFFLKLGTSMGSAAMLLLAGLGLGFFRIGAIDRTTDILPPEDRGVAGSLYNVMQVLGFVFAASFLLTFLAWAERITTATWGFTVTFATFGGMLGAYALILARISRIEPLKGN